MRGEQGTKNKRKGKYKEEEGKEEEEQRTMEGKKEEEVDFPSRIQPWADPSWLSGDSMLIPAGESDVSHSFSYAFPIDLKIYTSAQIGRAHV